MRGPSGVTMQYVRDASASGSPPTAPQSRSYSSYSSGAASRNARRLAVRGEAGDALDEPRAGQVGADFGQHHVNDALSSTCSETGPPAIVQADVHVVDGFAGGPWAVAVGPRGIRLGVNQFGLEVPQLVGAQESRV